MPDMSSKRTCCSLLVVIFGFLMFLDILHSAHKKDWVKHGQTIESTMIGAWNLQRGGGVIAPSMSTGLPPVLRLGMPIRAFILVSSTLRTRFSNSVLF